MTREELVSGLDAQTRDGVALIRLINTRISQAYTERMADSGGSVHALFSDLQHAWATFADGAIAWSSLNDLLSRREELDEATVRSLLEAKRHLESVLRLTENFLCLADSLSVALRSGGSVSHFHRFLEIDLVMVLAELRKAIEDLNHLHFKISDGAV